MNRKYILPLLSWIIANEIVGIVNGNSNELVTASSTGEEWVVRLEGGPQIASLLALQSGYKYLAPILRNWWDVDTLGKVRPNRFLRRTARCKEIISVLGFEDTYIWLWDDKQSEKRGGGPRSTKALNSSTKIVWADQQKIINRQKRDDQLSLSSLNSETPLIREKRVQLAHYRGNKLKEMEMMYRSDRPKFLFNDELWDQEWYLQDTRSNKALPKLDLNVLPLYRLGITGRSVRVAVLDDGLEYSHDDLKNNYDPQISYDVNEADNDPSPRYELTGMNAHGTRCAGEIAMQANNGKCGVGIAFGARIGGIKLLDGLVNDRVEGEALGYKPELVDIYTASWGPADDGKSLESPGRLATEALERGISMGRNGRGSIYVWASGNGGTKFDDCGCDGYVASIYTIAIGSASQTGRFPWYGEICPATLATTYSSGAYHDQMIATTDLKNTCTTKHTGTSASAPLAAGILALALETNKNLTWRDVQHLIAWTSEYSPLRENPGWFRNGAGFWFNSRFGFGLMNAYALVSTAYNWTSVPTKATCIVGATLPFDKKLVFGNVKRLTFETSNACNSIGRKIIFLEHVQIEVSLKYSTRGALQMHLTAPSGTKVQILRARRLDDSGDGFDKWRFMSVATWGEDPRGKWFLDISDEIGPAENNGTMDKFTLILHGTRDPPYYRMGGARLYNEDYNRIRKTDEEMLYNGVENQLNDYPTIKEDWFGGFLPF